MIRRSLFFAVLIFSAFLQSVSFADDPSVCEVNLLSTPSKIKLEPHKVGKSVSVVDGISETGYAKLTDALREVEGLRIKRLNGASGLTTVRVRGARSIDTKLLLDGLPLHDASDPQGSANPLFGDLPAWGFSRAEVLKGPSSSVHGSGAQGGVINVFSDLSEGFRAFSEYGTFSTFREGISFGRRFGGSSFAAHSSREDSKGFDHHDEYSQTAGSAAARIALPNGGTADMSFLKTESDAALNNAPYVSGGRLFTDSDDENDTRENSLLHAGISVSVPVSESLSAALKAGWTDSDRRFTFLKNSNGSGFFSDGTFEGESVFLEESVSKEHFGGVFISTLGHAFQRDAMRQATYLEPSSSNLRNETDFYSNDFFLEETADLGRLSVDAAARLNTHEAAKHRWTYDLSAAYVLPAFTILRAHYGTAYREPSPFETDGAFLSSFGRTYVGNKLLSPERTKGWDAGFEHPFGRLTVGASAFRTDTESRIDFVSSRYANVNGQIHSAGFDGFASWRVREGLDVRAGLTHILGNGFVDIPTNQWSLSAKWKAGRWIADAAGFYVGSRQIAAFNNDGSFSDRAAEDAHFTADLRVGYQATDNLEIYLRGENVFNEAYTDGGYRAPGARLYGGASLRF